MTAPPTAAARMEKKATEHGWRTRTRGAVGSHNGKDIEVFVLWMSRPGPDTLEQLVAVWENGAFRSGWQAWLPDAEDGGVSPRRVNSRELAAVVTS